MEVKVFVKEHHEDSLEVGDGGSIQGRGIVSESVPHTRERGDYQVDNGHIWEGGGGREGGSEGGGEQARE